MDLFFSTTVSGIEYGLCYAIAALGMYIAYSVLDFPDLSADGTFPLGGVIGTIALYNLHFPPLAALLAAFAAGSLMGALTGILHVKFRISKLLSGIIVMTALLSATLALTKVLTGTGFTTVNFSYIAHGIDGMFNSGNKIADAGTIILVVGAILLAVKILLDAFLQTKAGFLLRATGGNETLVSSLGKNVGFYKILGLALANGLVALSGALYAQLTKNYDNTSGSGKVVLTLASVIIGLALFSGLRSKTNRLQKNIFSKKAEVTSDLTNFSGAGSKIFAGAGRAARNFFLSDTAAVVVGALIYSLCLYYFTLLDSDGTYLKLMNAVCFAAILIVNNFMKRKRVNNKKQPLAKAGVEEVKI